MKVKEQTFDFLFAVCLTTCSVAIVVGLFAILTGIIVGTIHDCG